MIIVGNSLPFIKDYIDSLNLCMKKLGDDKGLTGLQCCWLRFVLLGLLVTNSLCWERFKRFSLGEYKTAGMCWMFRKARIAWEILLQASVTHIIEKYDIKSGILVVDDTDQERSKNTTEIAKVHKIKDKRSGGFFNGQNLVFLLLVSRGLTIPVGFKFYEPDPEVREWRIRYAKLREKGVAREHRPKKPEKNEQYPDKKELAVSLIKDFAERYKFIKIIGVVADAFYGKSMFVGDVESVGIKQIVSQIAKTQLIQVNGKYVKVGEFFESYGGKTEEIELRDGNKKKVTYVGGKFKVKSHDRKYWIIGVKYDGEEEYRFLIASDMTWRDVDVIKAYATRWLVEVFIQDWKSYEGWANLAKQRGDIGSDRGVILSLLCDHMLYFHEENLVSFKDNKSAVTVGSLRAKISMESLITFVGDIVKSDNPGALFAELAAKASELFALRSSTKHLQNFTQFETFCTA